MNSGSLIEARYCGRGGAGPVLGGSLRYAVPAWGLTLTGFGHGLLVHESDGFGGWSAGGSLQFCPGSAGRGPSLRVAQSWGGTTTSAQSLWSLRDAVSVTALDTFDPTGQLDAEFSYGLDALACRHAPCRLSPYAGLTLADGGVRRSPASPNSVSFPLSPPITSLPSPPCMVFERLPADVQPRITAAKLLCQACLGPALLEEAVRHDRVDLLLISPERFANERFRTEVLVAMAADAVDRTYFASRLLTDVPNHAAASGGARRRPNATWLAGSSSNSWLSIYLQHHGHADGAFAHLFLNEGGFYRNFFATLKAGAGHGGGVERMFITGVSPITPGSGGPGAERSR